MITYMTLDAETAPYFDNLTFPDYQISLQQFDATAHVAIGATTSDGLPVALVLAVIFPDQTARILSVYTDPDYRRQGIATELIQRMEAHLRARQARFITIRYIAENPALVGVLAKCSWTSPETNLITLRGPVERAAQLSFLLDPMPLPAGFRWIDWAAVEPEAIKDELDALEQIHTGGKFLSPLMPMDLPIHMPTSLALFQHDKLVGWMLNHRVDADTVRYSRLYVAQNLRGQGLSTRLIAESVRRHLQAGTPRDALFAAEPDNKPMRRVIDWFQYLPGAIVELQMRSYRLLNATPDTTVDSDLR